MPCNFFFPLLSLLTVWKGHFPSRPHLVSVFAQEVFLSVICSDTSVQTENNRGKNIEEGGWGRGGGATIYKR